MTMPEFSAVPELSQEARDFIPLKRCKGLLMIVRPYEYQREGFITVHAPDGTDVVFADIACLDPIPAGMDDMGETLPGFAAGTQFRGQTVLQGFLKGTFRRCIGKTLIGTIYFEPSGKGKPSIKWQDLSSNQDCRLRGQQFFMAHPEFLTPKEAAFTPVAPEPTGPPAYVPPAPQGYVAPTSGAGAWSYHTQHAPLPPRASQAPEAAPVSGPAHPNQGMSTLAQLAQYEAQQINHQGNLQEGQPPF